MKTGQMNGLIIYCHKMAETFLVEQGEFYPFGVCLDKNGRFVNMNPYKGDEFPLSDEVFLDLKNFGDGLIENTSILAYGIGYDVRITSQTYPQSTDAIRIYVRSDSLHPVSYYYPYSLVNNIVNFDEPWAELEK